jgi:hypothetical protein
MWQDNYYLLGSQGEKSLKLFSPCLGGHEKLMEETMRFAQLAFSYS